MGKPIVAIIGRQNVGKSTLFNKLVGRQVAIVEDLPGTTRDRIFADAIWQDTTFTLIDTGGLEPTPLSSIARGVQAQIEIAISEADMLIFLVDVREGVTPVDLQIAGMLRPAGKPIVLAVNKVDNARFESEAPEFYQLGLGEPLPVSAYHGRGVAELLDRIVSLLPEQPPAQPEPEAMKVAIVGRPGVGKSTLLNALLGEERTIVGEKPGTTRDAIDTWLDFDGEKVIRIAAPGIGKRGQSGVGVERYSVIRALQAIDRADIAVLVLDANEPASAQDTHVAGYIRQAMKGIVLVVNKWDMIENRNEREWADYLREQFKFVPYAPILYVSAKNKQGIDKIMPQVKKVYEERQKKLPPELVESIVQQAVAAHVLPRKGTRQLRVYTASQTGINPPTFAFQVNDAKLVHFSYQRYLENRLRQSSSFTGTPIRLVFKSRSEPS